MSNKRISKKANNKVGEYSLQGKFREAGYHAREDITTLPGNTLVAPSKNVLIGTSGRISSIAGYALDGQTSATIDSGILSNYDFHNFKGNIRNMRAGFLTTAGNDGKLQYRYKNSSGAVSWVNLMTGLTSIRVSFCDYWDNTNLIKLVLWVDGSNNVYSWNGAVTTFASGTADTITKQGTTTWQQEGFSATGSFTANGTNYTYTGGYGTTTLTGVSADTSGLTVGSEIHQTPVTVALSAMTGILGTLAPTVIGCGRRNQVYVGASTSNNLYISKVNDYTNYSFTSPTRVVGEGALIPLDSPPTVFIPQEVTAAEGGTSAYDMWISEGTSTWAVIRATLSNDLTKETLEHIRLKVAPLQGAKSGRLVSKMKNHILYVDCSNVASFIGYISYQYIPTIVDFSFPIVDDMNGYDMTDGSVFFYRNFNYIAIPKHGLIRVYNMTDQTKDSYSQYKAIEDVTQMPWFWESPIEYPISGFYVTEDGELGGHGYNASESYLLFKGGSFNGQDIESVAAFAYDDGGDRTQSKGSNEIWVDGYIGPNTVLNVTVAADLDSCRTPQTSIVDGADATIVCLGGGAHSLGDGTLGSRPLGGSSITNTPSTLPPYFHVIKTYPQVAGYLEQTVFETKGADLNWQIINFGTNKSFTTEGNNSITQ